MSSLADKVLAALSQTTGHQPVPRGAGWMTCCPAHDDTNPSLSVDVADDGSILLNCFARCPKADVLRAAGLTARDLFPDDGRSYPNSSTSTKPRKTAESSRFRRQKKQKRPPQMFPTAEQAAERCCKKFGPMSAVWSYLDADRRIVGRVVRWDLPDGKKEIRPFRHTDDGWTCEGLPEPRPLYRLPALLEETESRVFVVEGEKAADAALLIGLCATTSAGGSESPHKTDWSALAGRDVVIIPDNDDAGRAYAEAVARILICLDNPARVRIIDPIELWSDIPLKGDIADWCETFDPDNETPDVLKERVKTLADQTPDWKPTPPESTVASFNPFPVELLPGVVRDFIETATKSIGCDATFLALPLLSILGAAIGNTRRLRLKAGWEVPPVVWTAVVGKSGSMKTPAWSVAMECLEAIEGEADRQYAVELARYQARIEGAEQNQCATGEALNRSAAVRQREQPPTPPRFSVSDTTVEALAPLLRENPRGLLLSRDELSGWIGSFDKFSKGGRASSDVGHWLTMFNAKPLRVDRKTGEPRTIKVKSAAVSICGGIQPSTLRRSIGREHRENGLLARFLLVWPPQKPKRWTDDEIPHDIVESMTDVVRRLTAIDFPLDRFGEPTAGIVKLSPDAKTLFRNFYDEHSEEQNGLDEDLAAAWSKLEEYAARLALIIHQTRVVSEVDIEPNEIDADSMAAGIDLTRWFCAETRRVYGMLDQSEQDRQRDELLDWIRRRGGEVSIPEVQRGHRRFHSAADTEAALEELVQAGFGLWKTGETTQRGGRPSVRFVLNGD